MSGETSQEAADAILNDILTTNTVSPEQVQALDKYVHADWVVDRGEAELLFKANQSIGPMDEACPAWTDFFSDTVTKLVLMDMESPGEIDKEEGDWLGELIEKHPAGNASEKKLFADIEKISSKIEGKAASHLQAKR